MAGEVQVRSRHIAGRSGAVLMCQARPCSDVEIAPKRIEKRTPPLRKTLTASVYRLARPAADVSVLTLRFANGVRANSRPVSICRCCCPMATGATSRWPTRRMTTTASSCTSATSRGGRFSEAVLARIEPRDKLVVELPFGQFFLREAEMPAILLATGTGFAPIKSIVEDTFGAASASDAALSGWAPSAMTSICSTGWQSGRSGHPGCRSCRFCRKTGGHWPGPRPASCIAWRWRRTPICVRSRVYSVRQSADDRRGAERITEERRRPSRGAL